MFVNSNYYRFVAKIVFNELSQRQKKGKQLKLRLGKENR